MLVHEDQAAEGGIEMQDYTTLEDDDSSSEDSTVENFECRSFTLDIVSNAVFLIGSSAYLYLAISDVNVIDFYNTLDDNLRETDDYYYWNVAYNWTNNSHVEWEDDFLFYIDETKTSVSQYQIVYFSAAFAFLVVGIVDLVHETTGRPDILDPEASPIWNRFPKFVKRIFGCLNIYQWGALSFITGGCFGCSSALVMGNSAAISAKLSSASVHFYLIEAFTVMGRRHLTLKQVCSANNLLYFGDAFWLIGAFIDVVLSYCYLRDDLIYNENLTAWGVVAALLWLIDALFYIAGTLIIYRNLRHADRHKMEAPLPLDNDISVPVLSAVPVDMKEE
eukprot:CAMPEP_0194357786 /NCGR_PEP_ID=MMETSP0174-20130528/5226_1 /TAXON_ID=216777 /ORGANISM="Proboscia alata, Strain PI-D3" /LENGTH=333 /DNA_ID=CAMNT_0039127957 /DNA_START=112 /DNA_END=1113 /DNA_ORIENTATION=+